MRDRITAIDKASLSGSSTYVDNDVEEDLVPGDAPHAMRKRMHSQIHIEGGLVGRNTGLEVEVPRHLISTKWHACL